MSNYRTPPSYHICTDGLRVAINGVQHLLVMDSGQLIALAEDALAAARMTLRATTPKTPETDPK